MTNIDKYQIYMIVRSCNSGAVQEFFYARPKMVQAGLFPEFAKGKSLLGNEGRGVKTTFVKHQRIGLHVYYNPTIETVRAIKMLDFKELAGDHKAYRITFKNTGNGQINCNSDLELTSLEHANNAPEN